MAGGSVRKKSINKRSIPKSQNLHMPPISTSTMPSFPSQFKISLIVCAFSVVVVITLFGISSNRWGTFGSTAHADPLYSIEVVNEFPHDSNAFTQGLSYAGNDTLFESTGLRGHSSVRKVALHTGKVEALHKMDNSYFGEGLTLFGQRLFQVTWLEKTGFIYDRNNLSEIGKFTNQMQDGWGLANDGKMLFGSDGSSTLYQIDPQTMKVEAKQIVKYKGQEVYNLNELEYINGEVWANIWQSDCIARISPRDGNVNGWILLQKLSEGLFAAGYRNIDVLNGIAWDMKQSRLFVTGKLWPKLYEIKLQPLRKPLGGPIEKICMRDPVHFR